MRAVAHRIRFASEATTNNNIPASTKWQTKDIIYTSIVGTIMLAALLEWILWLMAFLYCLVKVFKKAGGKDKAAIRVLALFNMAFFVLMRCMFLPIMLVTLPLPSEIVKYFPEELISIMQWIAFWTFAGLLTVPWLVCVYQLVIHNVGRTKRIKTVLDEQSAPKVAIVMPCYNEQPGVLLRTVDSIVDCDYPPSCLHILLSFDGDHENELYLHTIEQLGVPLTLESYPKSIDVIYRRCRITVSRFPHGGKRSCQKKTYRLIDKIYAEYLRRNDNLFLLFIDSDCILDKVCIQNFMYEMELKPGSKHTMLAMTGVITSTTTKNSLITVLQDMEYVHGQLFERSVESGCGAVTCLPGALTVLRFSAFRRMAKYYFAAKAEQCDDLFDYGKCHLGEDRWLTHLFMCGAQKRYQIQMNTGAFCKTEAVQSFRSLLKQRRRWFLGFITNEACMLCDRRLWKRYPLLVIIRLATNTIRTTALLFFIMINSIMTTPQEITKLPVGFIAVSLGLNWVLMLYFGAKLGRYKIMLYPLMFVLNPVFNYIYVVYGIFTAGQRTWGGPRADAGKADQKTTPEQAVQQAVAQGNDLNIVPETFKPALEASRHRVPHQAPLLPSGHLEGRFAPATEIAGGWFRHEDDSGVLHADMAPRYIEEAGFYRKGFRRNSDDSFWSSDSPRSSIHTPRRVESIFGAQDTLVYRGRQASQRPAGGAYFERAEFEKTTSATSKPQALTGNHHEPAPSVRSSGSASSISLHFQVPLPHRNTGDETLAPQAEPINPTSAQTSTLIQPRAHTRDPTSPNVTVPAPTHQSGSRRNPAPRSSVNRTGRSPLARKSFTRVATDDAVSTPGEDVELPDRPSRRHSVGGHERRGRQSISVDRGGRRRLSKNRRPPSEARRD